MNIQLHEHSKDGLGAQSNDANDHLDKSNVLSQQNILEKSYQSQAHLA